MINIKIPSPSINMIFNFIEKNKLDETETVNEYLSIVSNTLNYIGGSRLRYRKEVLTKNAITADIDLGSLPLYADMIEHYADIGLENEFIQRIEAANSKFGASCPKADEKALRKPIRSWHPRWVTVYIWVLMCCEHSKDTFCTDLMASNAIFLELTNIATE